MLDSEIIIDYISRVRQLAADLDAMDTHVDDQKLAMTVLLATFEHLIVAMDGVSDDESLVLDFVKSRLPQKMEKNFERHTASAAGDTVLVNNCSSRNKSLRVSIC